MALCCFRGIGIGAILCLGDYFGAAETIGLLQLPGQLHCQHFCCSAVCSRIRGLVRHSRLGSVQLPPILHSLGCQIKIKNSGRFTCNDLFILHPELEFMGLLWRLPLPPMHIHQIPLCLLTAGSACESVSPNTYNPMTSLIGSPC